MSKTTTHTRVKDRKNAIFQTEFVTNFPVESPIKLHMSWDMVGPTHSMLHFHKWLANQWEIAGEKIAQFSHLPIGWSDWDGTSANLKIANHVAYPANFNFLATW